jgi:hypothetical protein
VISQGGEQVTGTGQRSHGVATLAVRLGVSDIERFYLVGG